MYSKEFQPIPQQNGYVQNPQDFENEKYETEYESDNQFQPETVINPDLSMNGPPTLRSVTPANSVNYGFGQGQRPLYDPHYEWNYDTKTMTEEEKAKLKLHQGSVCQLSEKNPNPNYKNELAEYSHIDEATKYMIPKSTVCQFDKKNPNPNYKNELAEYSHVDEATKYMIQKPTVAQFQKKVPDFVHLKGLPQKTHLPDEEIYNKKQTHNLLQLHQGSVLQQPKHGDYEHVKKYMAYRPKPDSLREEMPIAKIPNRIPLPSQVKKMQTYITHPPSRTIRSIGFDTNSAPTSPTLGRKNIWPPNESGVRQLPRTGFNPNVMYQEDNSRKHVWPPADSNRFGSLNDLNQKPIPTIGTGPAAGVWNPDPDGNRSSTSYARFNPQQKINSVWPPNRTGSMINLSTSSSSPMRRPEGTDDRYVRHTINTAIPLTYRTPPNTQYYEVPYKIMNANDENNNQLNQNQLYDEQQQLIKMNAFKQQQPVDLNRSGNLAQNYYDTEQQINNQTESQYQQQLQQLQQQQRLNQPQLLQQQLQQPVINRASNSSSPIHFDATQLNSSYNQQQNDLYLKQQQQQQQLREFERAQAEKLNITNQQRSHHLHKQPQQINGNLVNIQQQQQFQQIDYDELENVHQQQQFIAPNPQQPIRSKSPVFRPVSPRNIYQRQPNQQQQEIINNQQQQITSVQQLPSGSTQIITQYSQPTIVKQLHQEQTINTQVEMQKQYYVQQPN